MTQEQIISQIIKSSNEHQGLESSIENAAYHICNEFKKLEEIIENYTVLVRLLKVDKKAVNRES